MPDAPSSAAFEGGNVESAIASRSPKALIMLMLGAMAALIVGVMTWRVIVDHGACDDVNRADVESVLLSPVGEGEALTDDSRSGASGCGFTTQDGAIVSVWIGTDRELHGVVETMMASGDVVAGSPEAYVFSLGSDGESAVSSVDGNVVLVNAPGHSGAAAQLAQLIATRL